METHESEQQQSYVTFPLSSEVHVHDAIRETIVVPHGEACESGIDECVLQDGGNELTQVSVTNDVNATVRETQETVEILQAVSEEEDESSVVFSTIYIKQEDQQQYTSGDDETMAVEALRQLGGMYPSFEDKKIVCPNCKSVFSQAEFAKHHLDCNSGGKLFCTVCKERFERKIDLNNHMVCHQVARPHACRACGNLFRSKNSLQIHMAHVHQVEKPHKCTICGTDFQRPSSLSNHMKIHSYIAGRAILQSPIENGSSSSSSLRTSDSFEKWSENDVESKNDTVATSSSTHSINEYDITQVQWTVPVPSYQQFTDQIDGNGDQQQKLEAVQEFAVLPNGEVARFEYADTDSTGTPQYHRVPLHSYENPEAGAKIRDSQFVENQNNFTEDVAEKQEDAGNLEIAKTWSMPVECEFCDKQFQDSHHLASHQMTCAKKAARSNAEQGKHACSECGKKFTTKQKMFRHQWIHRKKTHSCEVCGTQFEKQNQLDEHRLSAHPGDSPFTCSDCGKSFASRQGLWEHGRIHVGSPAHFRCGTCSKTFSSRQGYLIHYRTHTGERPYGCKFCWKAFRDGGTLKKHERIHTGERPHVCPLCSRAFNQKVVLREHVRWIHAAGKNESKITGPPFPCPLCGALSQDRDELCVHIVKHSDQMIADAKAKTNNNAPKPKPSRKKPKPSIGTAQNVQREAVVLSVIEPMEEDILETQHLLLEHQNEDNIMKQEKIAEYEHENSFNGTNKELKEDLQPNCEGVTLHRLMSQENDSLSVLAIPNPHGQDNLSSQIAQLNDMNTASIEIVTQHSGHDRIKEEAELRLSKQSDLDEASVIQYHQDSDDSEELVCGICGDDFHDKHVLMEHLKIHL